MIEKPLSDLKTWVAYLSETEFPVLRHTVQTLDQLRDQAENANGRILTGVIMHDPLMTLRVLEYIEKHRRVRQTTDITTIERALMMIGIVPFFRDFHQLPLVEDQLKAHPHALLGLIKATNRAHRAAHWARDWAILRHDLDVDEITLATLLHDIAELMMWCFAPSLALKAQQLHAEQPNRRSASIQIEIYGVSLNDLKLALAEAWHLPQLLTQLMDHQHAENPRVRNVTLAVDLARHSATSWDDPAIPDDFKGIRELLHINQTMLLRRLGIDESVAHHLQEAAEQAEALSRNSEDS